MQDQVAKLAKDIALSMFKESGKKALEWIKSFFNRKVILIIGAGGVGKTSMARFLEFGMSHTGVESEYNESIDTESFITTGDVEVKAFVVAGQKHRRDSTWPDVLQQIGTGEINGVILVNAFGYHSIGPGGKKFQREYQSLPEERQEQDFLQEHLRAKKLEEIEVLKYIAPYIKRASDKIWLLSVISKEDLWFNQNDKVREHYHSGKYHEIVDDILKNLGSGSFRHEIVEMSFFIQDFETGKGELLSKRCENYDQRKQVNSAKNLIQMLSALCKDAQ